MDLKAFRFAVAPCLISTLLAAHNPAQAEPDDSSSGKASADPRAPDLAPPTPAAPSTETTDKLSLVRSDQPTEQQERARFAEFDKLRAQGLTSDFPGAFETLTQDVGGFRSWLHEHDLYFRGVSSNNVNYDLAAGNEDVEPRAYVGQGLTASQSNEMRISWKLAGSGGDITQINFGGLFNFASWRQIGPTGARFNTLNVYSSFFDRTLELKAGFYGNISDFVGIFSGGNPILASGVAGSIPLSTGMSGGTVVAPTASVQINFGDGFYTRTAVQRSSVPEGPIEDAANAGHGLKFKRPGARAMFIEEFGVRRPASRDHRQIWARAGGTYNRTRYERFDGEGRDNNWSLYALADYQAWRPETGQAYRGIYTGVSALFASDAVNVTTRSLEARVYALGMVPGRPSDQMTLTLGNNRFSRHGRRAIEAGGGIANRQQYSVGALYAFHVTEGLFVSPSLTYIRNPSFVGDLKPALNVGLSMAVLF